MAGYNVYKARRQLLGGDRLGAGVGTHRYLFYRVTPPDRDALADWCIAADRADFIENIDDEAKLEHGPLWTRTLTPTEAFRTALLWWLWPAPTQQTQEDAAEFQSQSVVSADVWLLYEYVRDLLINARFGMPESTRHDDALPEVSFLLSVGDVHGYLEDLEPQATEAEDAFEFDPPVETFFRYNDFRHPWWEVLEGSSPRALAQALVEGQYRFKDKLENFNYLYLLLDNNELLSSAIIEGKERPEAEPRESIELSPRFAKKKSAKKRQRSRFRGGR